MAEKMWCRAPRLTRRSGDRAVPGIVTAVPAGRPADHLERMIVSVADDVTSRVGEAPDDVHVAGCCRPVHGEGVVALLAGVDVQAALEQQAHDVQMTGITPPGAATTARTGHAQVHPVGILVQQRRQGRELAGADRSNYALVDGQAIGRHRGQGLHHDRSRALRAIGTAAGHGKVGGVRHDRDRPAARPDRPGLQPTLVARHQPARVAPRPDARPGGMAAACRSTQRPGNRRARRVLEIRRPATADGGEARLVPARGLELVRAAERADATTWKADLRLLDDCHRRLRETVASLDPKRLRRSVGGSTTALDLVTGIIAHDVYHAGQIQLLKRMRT